MFDLAAVQSALRQFGLDGWLLAEFRGSNVLARRVLEEIPSLGMVSIEREIFPRWVGRGLYGCPCDAPFLDIGTPASLVAAERFILQHQTEFLP